MAYLKKFQTFRGHKYATRAPDNPKLALKRDGSGALLRAVVDPFSDYLAAARDFIGYPRVAGPKSGHYYLSRMTPMSATQFFGGLGSEPQLLNTAGDPFLYCVEAPDIYPAEMQGGAYQIALFDLKFESLPYDVKEDSQLPQDATYSLPTEGQWSRYVTVTGGAETQSLQMPRGSFYYAGTTARHPYPGGFILSKSAVKCVWHEVPTAAIASLEIPGSSFAGTAYIDQCRGCVNADTFNGHKPGTLLFETWSYEPHRSAFGDRTWDVTFNFSKNPVKWNYVPRPNGTSATWTLITADGSNPADNDNATGGTANDGKRLYNTRAFFQMFLCPDP